MSKQEILRELKSLLNENFDLQNLDASKSLFSVDIGFTPRDLVKFVILIEHKFNVKFSENELSKDDFDCLNELAAMIYTHLSD